MTMMLARKTIVMAEYVRTRHSFATTTMPAPRMLAFHQRDALSLRLTVTITTPAPRMLAIVQQDASTCRLIATTMTTALRMDAMYQPDV